MRRAHPLRVVAALILIALLGMAVLALATLPACHHPAPLPPATPPTFAGDLLRCIDRPAPLSADVCRGSFAEGYPCAKCGAITGCLDVQDGVWCTSTGTCDGDPRCAPSP